MKIFGSCDPGLSGHFCVIDTTNIVKVTFIEMPTIKEKNKTLIDIPKLVEVLKPYHFDSFYLESVHSMHGQGVCSVWSFGEGFGIVKGVLTALNIKYKLISPQYWKNRTIDKELRLLGKQSSCIAAEQIAKKENWNIIFPRHKRSGEIFDGASDSFCMVYLNYLENK